MLNGVMLSGVRNAAPAAYDVSFHSGISNGKTYWDGLFSQPIKRGGAKREEVCIILKRILQKIRSNRLLCTQLLFVALAFVAMVSLSYIFMRNIVHGNLIRNVNNVLDVAETRLISHLQELEATMEGFSGEVRQMVSQGEAADGLKTYMDEISHFAALDGGGFTGIRGFYGYFETLPGGPVLLAGEGLALPDAINPLESAWYQTAAAAGGAVVETAPYIGDEGDTMLTFAKYIQDSEGRGLGVVCMDVNINVMGQAVVNTALNQGGYGMLMNQDLLTMFHPNPEFVGISMDDPRIPVYIFADALHSGEEIFERPLTSYKNEEALAFFRKLPNNWQLGLVTPKSQYYASMTTMTVTQLVLGAVLAAILIGILIRIDLTRVKSEDENKKKSMFLANMSHEIRTPINAIVGMTAIGRAAGMTERKDYCFSKIDSASKHLLGVVNDILDISKIEANKIALSPANFNFEKMLQQAVNVSNFRADEKRQKLTVHIDKSIPRYLYADDQRLAQVITNLLSNAIKFTPDEGTITLRTKFQGEVNGLCTVKVEVADSGIGISPEQQTRLFQPFQQAESSTTRKYGGTGLGLAISKSIVEIMGGEIRVESKLGQGTTMAFTVQVKRGEESYFDLGRQGVNWESVRILTIDDDLDILTYFQETVTSLGAKCDIAANAGEALRYIEQNGAYNIYFVDLRMPGTDGISLTQKIRAAEVNPGNSVVIMISSADLSAIEGDARKAGVNKFLLKPLFPSAIADVINECIGLVNIKSEEDQKNITGIFAGRRILFAEDVEINREIVLTLLEPTLLEIDCAENGLEAVQMFNGTPEKYDMIFMDVQMPEMDGYEATRQIRALECQKAKTVPIVAMTANVFKEDIESCLAAGMNSHLGKPLDMDDVIKVLRKYLYANGAAQGTGAASAGSVPAVTEKEGCQ